MCSLPNTVPAVVCEASEASEASFLGRPLHNPKAHIQVCLRLTHVTSIGPFWLKTGHDQSTVEICECSHDIGRVHAKMDPRSLSWYLYGRLYGRIYGRSAPAFLTP